MDYSPAEGSTSHILLLSDSVVQPSNSNSDTDVSTDTSIAATPQESGTLDLRVQSLSIVVTGAAPSLHVLFGTTYLPLLVPFQTQLQLPQFHSKLQQLALVDYPITGSYPLNRRLIHPDFHFCSVWWSENHIFINLSWPHSSRQ